MESNVKELRDQIRFAVVESRQASREKIWKNKRKALEDVLDIGRNVSEQEVIILANKLKSRSLVQAEDLALLKIAFVHSAINIVAFLKVKGALHGLVRELSSIKANVEFLAAECVCNLALGDARSCLVIARAAGPYLITILSGFNVHLMARCVWALGNLVGSGEKTWKIIHSQGFMGKLLHLIEENDKCPDLRQDLQDSCVTALSQFLRVGAKHLTDEEIHTILKTIVNLKNSLCDFTVSVFLLSCMDTAEKELVENKIHMKSLELISRSDLSVDTVTAFTACVRIIANLVSEQSGICALELIQHWNLIQETIQKIYNSNYRHLPLEFGWLLGNLINHPSPEVKLEIVKFNEDFQYFESKLPS